MFYETAKNNHGLPRNPFKACVMPRPIGWITSQDSQGKLNLAPYSYFNAVSDIPPMVMFSTGNKLADGREKDTLSNVETTKEFVVNIATWDLREEMNVTSGEYAHEINEIEFAKLETVPSILVKPPRIKQSPIHLECRYFQSVQLPGNNDGFSNRVVIGEVIGVHIDEKVLTNGKVDINKVKPIARLGYMDYAVILESFEMIRPD